MELTNNGYDIVFDNVDFSYDEKTKVLHNVTALTAILAVVKLQLLYFLWDFGILIREKLWLVEWIF